MKLYELKAVYSGWNYPVTAEEQANEHNNGYPNAISVHKSALQATIAAETYIQEYYRQLEKDIQDGKR